MCTFVKTGRHIKIKMLKYSIIEKNPNLISEVFIDAINKKINKKIKQVNYETINNNRINKFYEIIKEESK